MKLNNNQVFLEITNETETHDNYKFTDGPYCVNKQRNYELDGISFTTQEYILDYIDHGIWIREIKFNNNEQPYKKIHSKLFCLTCPSNLVSSTIILGKKYSIFSKTTQELYNINAKLVPYAKIIKWDRRLIKEIFAYFSNEDIIAFRNYFLDNLLSFLFNKGVELVSNFIIHISQYIGKNDVKQIGREIISELIVSGPYKDYYKNDNSNYDVNYSDDEDQNYTEDDMDPNYFTKFVNGEYKNDYDPMNSAFAVGKILDIDVTDVIINIQISVERLLTLRQRVVSKIISGLHDKYNAKVENINCDLIVLITRYLDTNDLDEIGKTIINYTIQTKKNVDLMNLIMTKFKIIPNLTIEQINTIVILMLKKNKITQLCEFMDKGYKCCLNDELVNEIIHEQIKQIKRVKQLKLSKCITKNSQSSNYIIESFNYIIESSLSIIQAAKCHKFIVNIMVKRIMIIMEEHKLLVKKYEKNIIDLCNETKNYECIDEIHMLMTFCNKLNIIN